MIAENKPAGGASPKAPKKVVGRPFVKGWKGGPGNPFGGKLEKLRAALIGAVTPADFKAIARTWVKLARGGDVRAGEVLCDKILGKTTPEERSSLVDVLKALALAHDQEAAEQR